LELFRKLNFHQQSNINLLRSPALSL